MAATAENSIQAILGCLFSSHLLFELIQHLRHQAFGSPTPDLRLSLVVSLLTPTTPELFWLDLAAPCVIKDRRTFASGHNRKSITLLHYCGEPGLGTFRTCNICCFSLVVATRPFCNLWHAFTLPVSVSRHSTNQPACGTSSFSAASSNLRFR